MSSFFALLASVTAVFLIGCGPSGLKLNPVSGTVTFDGEPLPEGRIQFRAVEGDQRAFSGAIEQGRYTVETMPGKMAVEITASRIIPGKFDESNPGEKTPVGEMYIPARYNSATELTAEIPSGGVKQLDFTLTGK
ncbi:MAG: hypothetical protein ACOX1P_19015 [Thermoguttaceae bacterium]